MARSIILTTLLMVILTGCKAYKNGWPIRHCIDGMPEHHNTNPTLVTSTISSGSGVYTITTNSATYTANQLITITLSGTQKFEGFMIAVHSSNPNAEAIVGKFTVYDAKTIRPYSWYSNEINCLTHIGESDFTTLQLTWQAPAASVGDVIVRATFVEDYEVIYIVEKPISGPAIVAVTFPWQVSSNTTINNFALDACGSTKGCVLWPKSCTGSDCEVALTYTTSGGYVDFQLIATSASYASVSFSGDKRMGDDETISCVYKSASSMEIQHGYNVGYWNARIKNVNPGISDAFITKSGSKMYCGFRRPLSLGIEYYSQNEGLQDEDLSSSPTKKTATVSLTGDWFVFIGWGSIYSGITAMQKHIQLPVISPSKVDFQTKSKIFANAIPAEIQAHGTLMLLAWYAVAGVSMVIARHCKDVFTKPIAGIKLWFQLHRVIMFSVAIITAASFILIFVYVDGLAIEAAGVHAIFGIFVMIFTVAQVTGSFFRPDPNTPKRPIFNWIHRIGGCLTAILATVTIILGMNVSFLPEKFKTQQTIITVLWMIGHIVFELILEGIQYWISKKCESAPDTKVDSPDGAVSSTNQLTVEQTPRKKNTLPIFITVIVYIFVNFIFLIVCNVYLYNIY